MRIHKSISIVPPLAACLFSGCATMFAGTKAGVRFTSVPSGATVVAGDLRGTTPVTLQLAKSTKSVQFIPPAHPATLKASMESSRLWAADEREILLDRQLSMNWFFLDLLFTPGFGLVGGIVDGSTSAWYVMPETVHCDFTKDPGASADSSGWFQDRIVD